MRCNLAKQAEIFFHRFSTRKKICIDMGRPLTKEDKKWYQDQAYRKTRIGYNHWLSPEIVNGKIYSREIDVWAFGCFIYELGKG